MGKFKFSIRQEIIIDGDNENDARETFNILDLGHLNGDDFNKLIESHEFIEVLSVEELEPKYPFNEGDEYWTAEYVRNDVEICIKAYKSTWDENSEAIYKPTNVYFTSLDVLLKDTIKNTEFDIVLVFDYIKSGFEIYLRGDKEFKKVGEPKQ